MRRGIGYIRQCFSYEAPVETAMKKLFLSALAATMVLTSAVTADAGQYRKKYRGVDPGAAIAAGIIGLAAGAIIAGAANSGRDRYYDGDGYGGAQLVGYDEYGNPIYRKRYRPRPQPYYYGGYQAQPPYDYAQPDYRYRPINRYRDGYGNYPYAGNPYRAPRRAADVAPEDRLRSISDRQRAYRKHCERYGCPPSGY